MKTVVGVLVCVLMLTSCANSKNYASSWGGSGSSVRKWKPVKDKTSYQKTMKYAEKD